MLSPKEDNIYLPACYSMRVNKNRLCHQWQELTDSYEIAVDASNLWMTTAVEDLNEPVPEPTPAEKIQCPANARVMLVQTDTEEYLKKTDTKSVRRTVSIPSWMDHIAQKRGISLSIVLQDVLRAQIG